MATDSGNEVFISDKRNKNNGRKSGITPIEFWENHFSNAPSFDDLKELANFPGIDDAAGMLRRGVYRNEDQRIALVELLDLAEKHGLERHKKLIRNNIASTQGWYGWYMNAVLQAITGMVMPGVIREQLQMKKVKNGEDIQKASDFRSEGREKESRKSD